MQKVDPLTLAMDSWRLGLEAWTVIGLRVPKLLAGNPAALVEAQRMIVEKIEALGTLQWMALTGGLGTTPHAALKTSVAHYRKAVGQNRKRLARRKR